MTTDTEAVPGGIFCPNCGDTGGFRTCDIVLCANPLVFDDELQRWVIDEAEDEVFWLTQSDRAMKRGVLMIECLSCGYEFETREVYRPTNEHKEGIE